MQQLRNDYSLTCAPLSIVDWGVVKRTKMPKLRNGSRGRIRTRALSIASPAFHHWATALHDGAQRYNELIHCIVLLFIQDTLHWETGLQTDACSASALAIPTTALPPPTGTGRSTIARGTFWPVRPRCRTTGQGSTGPVKGSMFRPSLRSPQPRLSKQDFVDFNFMNSVSHWLVSLM